MSICAYFYLINYEGGHILPNDTALSCCVESKSDCTSITYEILTLMAKF